MSQNLSFNKQYWEENIEGFSGFYDKQSEENIPAPLGVSFFYRKVIFPLEKKYMFQRHTAVSDYVSNNVKPGMKAADIGCGSGVYVKKMIQNDAFVYAYDYAESALKLTRRNLTGEELTKCEIKQLDVSKEQIAPVNVAISIGVLPYVNDVDTYLQNILPYTDKFLFNYLEKGHFINVLRRSVLKFLDVRKYSYHSNSRIMNALKKHNFIVVKKTKLATGFILETKRK